jgi:hypothetical protein
VGETVTVNGTVVEVFLSKGGNDYLNFGAAFPDQTFSGDVLAKKTPELVVRITAGIDWADRKRPRGCPRHRVLIRIDSRLELLTARNSLFTAPRRKRAERRTLPGSEGVRLP